MRKQTVFLTLALLCMIATLMLPLVFFEPASMCIGNVMYSCCMLNDGHMVSMAPIGLLVITTLTCAIMAWAIFARKRLLGNNKVRVANRKLQSKLCVIVYLLLIAWYGYGFGVAFALKGADTPRPAFAVVLPAIALILTFMARSGIKADERLVRSADRLR